MTCQRQHHNHIMTQNSNVLAQYYTQKEDDVAMSRKMWRSRKMRLVLLDTISTKKKTPLRNFQSQDHCPQKRHGMSAHHIELDNN